MKNPPSDDRSDSSDDPPSMRYQMIGDDQSTLEEKLAKYAGEAQWEDLKPHLANGALVYVDPMLDLDVVGKAFSEDDKVRVASWLKAGDLLRPSQPHAVYWESVSAVFKCRIVSPFVLIQPVSSD